jgi:1-aminocyclopropane-1-carboxylate synthase
MLAPRSARARQPALSYFAAFIKACGDLWSPQNPDGFVVVSVAENRLSKQSVADALAAAPPPPLASLGYLNFRGLEPLRLALAGVMQRTLLREREAGRRRRRNKGGGSKRGGGDGGEDAACENGEDGGGTGAQQRGAAAKYNDEEDGDAKEAEEERRLLVRDMFLACGAGSVVDLLFHLLASAGDGVLIPAPYYPAFDNDLVVRDAVVPVPVFLDLGDGVDRTAALPAAAFPAAGPAAGSGGQAPLPTPASLPAQLEAAAQAWEAQAAAGRAAASSPAAPPPRVRALLLTNPSNPLGTLLRRSQLLEAARWAHARGVHLVCDEVYGAMVWGEEDDEEEGEEGDDKEGDDNDGDARFVSAWRLLTSGAFAKQLAATTNSDGDGTLTITAAPFFAGDEAAAQRRAEALTHVIWGLSKDFCASGLRVGALLSRNPGVLEAWGNLSYFNGIPFPLQYDLAHVLSDEAWVDKFWRDNRAAMRASWETLAAALDAAGIPFVRGARGAMFCWVDLREGLATAAAATAGGEEAEEGKAAGGEEAGAVRAQDWEAERALWRALVRDARVVVTPGEACHAPEPGFFRVCWAWMPRDALPVAVARIRALLDARRKK